MRGRWLDVLLALYPSWFRERRGTEIREVVRQMYREPRYRTVAGRARLVVRLLVDTLSTSLALRATPRRRPSGPSRTRSSLMEAFVQDIRYAFRTHLQRPGFSAVVVLTLALGIGANAALFSIVSELVLRPIPIGEPSRVVDVFARTPGGNSFTGFSFADHRDIREGNDVLSGLAAFTARRVGLGSGMATERIPVQFSTLNYFDVVDVEPVLGRAFHEGDRRSGLEVVVVSHRFWQRRTGGDPGILGRTVHLGGRPFEVVGVAPEGFEGTFVGFPMEGWAPLEAAEGVLAEFDLDDPDQRGLEMIGRLRDGVSVERARVALDALAVRLEEKHPVRNRGHRIGVVPTTGIDHSMRRGVLGFLGILMVVAGLVLAITCLDVAGMLLVRATSRRREMSLRRALGAGASHLSRQLLVEVAVLFVAGAAAGLAVARALTTGLLQLVSSTPVPIRFDLDLDWRVLAFTFGSALLTSVLTGLVPLRSVLQNDLVGVLRAGSVGEDRGSGRIRRIFVVAQVGAAVVLLVGAGLFLRSLQNGARLDPGFDADRVAALRLVPPEEGDDVLVQNLHARVLEGVRALPGVEAASLAERRPIGVATSPVEVEIVGREIGGEGELPVVDALVVGADYFRTLGIPLLGGRAFGPEDTADGSRVAIVDRTMAERFWPSGGVAGKTVRIGDDEVRIVGVAAASRTLIQDDAPRSLLYLPEEQNPVRGATLLVRFTTDLHELREALGRTLAEIDPGHAPSTLTTLRETIDSSLLPQRLAAAVTVTLGAFGLVLASVGIFGVFGQTVARRQREIGIRIALGGTPRTVVASIVGRGMQLVAVGVAAGLAGVALVAPLLGSFLVEVSALDPLVVGGVIAVFAGVATGASWIPARRAASVSVADCLREE